MSDVIIYPPCYERARCCAGCIFYYSDPGWDEGCELHKDGGEPDHVCSDYFDREKGVVDWRPNELR